MFRIIIYSIALLYTLTGNDNQYPKAWDELQSDEGWELINVVYAPLQDKASSDIIYYFKRPKAETLK